MSAASVDAVLFDFDGTLMLTEERNSRVWDGVLDELELRLDPPDRRRIMGHRIGEVVTLLAASSDRPIGLDELTGLYRRHNDIVLPADEVLAPGAGALIAALRDRDMRLGVVTSGNSVTVRAILDRLGVGADFAVIVGGDGVVRGKPDPEPYLTALTALGAPPATTVAIEDSPAGVASSTSAGLRCIAITSTHQPADLTAATHVVEHLDDCVAILT